MALDSLNLYIAYTHSVKKSVGPRVKADVENLSLQPPQRLDKARNDKGENDSQHREDQGESGTLVAVCLRQDIACSDVEQKTGKEAHVRFTLLVY